MPTTDECTFCGKTKLMVESLLTSPNGVASICNECATICYQLLSENNEKTTGEAKSRKLPTPEEIKIQLDDYIVGQDKAKRVLSVGVYNHYKRINELKAAKKDAAAKGVKDDVELEKSNILMLGPTGSGKTLLAKTLAKILDVPFATADATTLTEAGYVGEDVENVLLKLIQAADYDIAKAERGIIYIDEIDKITRKSENMSITRDVSGEGVQQALLKIIEATKASVPPQGGRKHPQQECIVIDTTNILFICGGAFIGLDKIVHKRKYSSPMGFGSNVISQKDYKTSELYNNLQPQDLIAYGLIPEFVGRLPITVALDALDEDALISILTQPKNALTKQYKRLLKMDKIELEFDPAAIRAIAKKAIELQIGARGLRSILEDTLSELMYSAPSDKSIDKVLISEETITKKSGPIVIRKSNSETA